MSESKSKVSRSNQRVTNDVVLAISNSLSHLGAMNQTITRDALATDALFLPTDGETRGVEWRIADGLTGYEDAVAFMEQRVANIRDGTAPEMVWLVEHPALYTAGTSAKDSDLVDPDRFPVFATGRGGEHTYHGPGQRVGYVMLDLKRRKQDVRAFVSALEAWIIGTLDNFSIKGERREDRVGVWVQRPTKKSAIVGTIAEDKIAAIGIRLRKWVSFHGISINVEPDLTHYDGIVPCGISAHGVTSLVDLGLPVTMDDLDIALKTEFEKRFGALGEK